MSTPHVTLNLQDARGVIELSGEITEETALRLERAFESCFDYYCYEEISMQISSPGGSAQALRHILNCMNSWRDRGYAIHTIGIFTVASAAANLLAVGEVGTRTLHKCSSVLYHQSRLAGTTSAITATGALNLAYSLRTLDDDILMQIAAHIVQGCGGVSSLRLEGLARCDLLASERVAISQSMGAVTTIKPQRWLESLRKTYSGINSEECMSKYVSLLAKRLEKDTPMGLCEAYALNLVDCVQGVPSLRPLTLKTTQRASDAPLSERSKTQQSHKRDVGLQSRISRSGVGPALASAFTPAPKAIMAIWSSAPRCNAAHRLD